MSTPDGKSPRLTMENHHDLAGKIHYFDWVIFNSKLQQSLPEGRNFELGGGPTGLGFGMVKMVTGFPCST